MDHVDHADVPHAFDSVSSQISLRPLEEGLGLRVHEDEEEDEYDELKVSRDT